jgi:hypothetical protein
VSGVDADAAAAAEREAGEREAVVLVVVQPPPGQRLGVLAGVVDGDVLLVQLRRRVRPGGVVPDEGDQDLALGGRRNGSEQKVAANARMDRRSIESLLGRHVGASQPSGPSVGLRGRARRRPGEEQARGVFRPSRRMLGRCSGRPDRPRTRGKGAVASGGGKAGVG